MTRLAVLFIIFAYGLIGFAPTVARAERIIATCTSGGCICAVSPLTSLELMFLAGDTVVTGKPIDPERDILVYEPDLGIMTWVDATLSDIQRSFGGTGDCPVTPVVLTDRIVPLDGVWQWRTLAETTSGCPADLGAMLATSRVAYTQTDVTWGSRFDPVDLTDSFPQPDIIGLPAYKWQKTGIGRWLSDNVSSRICTDGFCTQTALTLSAALVAPDRISGLLALRSSVDGAQAALMSGFGLTDCQVRVRYDIVRIGP